MTARNHAAAFLAATNPRRAILNSTKLLLEAAKKDPKIADKLKAVQKKLEGEKSRVSDEQIRTYERIKQVSARPIAPDIPEYFTPVVSALYLRAKAVIPTSKQNIFSSNLHGALDNALKTLDSLEPSFTGELIVETTLNAREDPQFARLINVAESDFRVTAKNLEGSDNSRDSDKDTGNPNIQVGPRDTYFWGILIALILYILDRVSASKDNN
jgi:hypothetical protein